MADNEIEKEGLISLYIHFQEETQKYLEHHRRYFTQFVAINLAVMSISLGLFYQFRSNNHDSSILIVLILPIFGVIISLIGQKVCDRFYKRFLESITVANKLYFLIKEKIDDFNLDDDIRKNKKPFPNNVYLNDSYLFPERWIGAMKSHDTSKEFTSKLHSGSNKWIRLIFWILVGINIFVILGISYINSCWNW